jgi:hypothetical protein
MAEAEIFTPLDLTPLLRDVNRVRKFHNLGVIGRLRPGATIAQAGAELKSIMAQLERDFPRSNSNMSVATVGMRDAIVGDTRPALLVLLGASLLVLLIACANVAGCCSRGPWRVAGSSPSARVGAGVPARATDDDESPSWRWAGRGWAAVAL